MQFSTLLSAVLSFAAVVYGQQVNGQNSFTYPLGGTLDSTVPLLVKWTPSTSGTITIKLLKGPPTNILDVAVVAGSIENTGSYTWNIPSSLQDSGSMPSGDKYGFKIIDDSTNTYEYSPPFDISVPDSTFAAAGAASSSKSASTSASATQATTTAKPTSATPTTTTESTPTVESTAITENTSIKENTTAASSGPTTLPSAIVEPTTTATGTALETTAATTLATQTSAIAAESTSTAKSDDNTTELGANKGPNIVLIIGVAAGAVVFLGLAIFAMIMVCRCKNRRKRQSTSAVQAMMVERPRSIAIGNGMYNRV